MIDPRTRKIMLKACSRCGGDLLFDTYEEDFACMQCGRHVSVANVLAKRPVVAAAGTVTQEPALAA